MKKMERVEFQSNRVITVDKDDLKNDQKSKEQLICFESKNSTPEKGGGITLYDSKERENLVHFYESVEFKQSNGKQIEIGVQWLRGVLSEKDYQEKVKDPLKEKPEEVIELDDFADAQEEEEESGVDKNYYNSMEPLKNFRDQNFVLTEADEFIAGRKRTTTERKKPRRRRVMTEFERELKKGRNEGNMKCALCGLRAEVRDGPILQTRCDCPTIAGCTPPSIRLHKRCYWKKITIVHCAGCQKKIYLPVP